MSNPSWQLHDLWDEAEAQKLTPSERLIYRSNLLGSDQRITNTGGGNTSSKLVEKDPLTGEGVDVLWVKGSGGDLRTSQLANFASLYQSKLLGLRELYASKEPRGVKTEAEDAMAACYAHCAFNLNPRAASIDTPLHSFVRHRHVDHMHPNAVISIAASRRSRELTSEVYGEDVGWTPWLRPGFELGLELERRCRLEPQLKGIVLGQHGLINWADDDRDCYRLTLSLIDRAAAYIEQRDKGEQTFGGQKYPASTLEERREISIEILPWLRERLSCGKRMMGYLDGYAPAQRFVNSHDAPRLAALGTSCPDHFLRTKIKPLYIPWDPSKKDIEALKALLEEGLEQYREDYATYYQRCCRPDSPAMRDPNPTVILIPFIGMLTWGASEKEARITGEFYNCAIEVMRGAEAIDEYVALPEQEAFDIEYWQLEEAKLRRLPAEKELSRRIVRLAGRGVDRKLATAIMDRVAKEGGVVYWGGEGETILTFGGIDHVVAVSGHEIVVSDAARSNRLQVGPAASVEQQVEAVLFLLSDRSAGIRDQLIAVDGRA
jgi:rhamnulose-1-phosphate aldolase/alcohol dehydrogenase